MSLKANNSQYFDKILFLILGEFPERLKDNFLEYTNGDNKWEDGLPHNVCFIGDDIFYVMILLGGFAIRDGTKIMVLSNKILPKI